MLLPYEFDAMLQALRRDMHREIELAAIHKEDAAWHMTNARMAKRLLETLNPKQRQSTFDVGSTTQIFKRAETELLLNAPEGYPLPGQ